MCPTPKSRCPSITCISKKGRDRYIYSTRDIITMLCIKVCGLFYYSLSNLSKYFREYASLLSHDFRNFTSLGE